MTAPADIEKSSSTNLYALDNFSNNEVGINAVKLSYSDIAFYGYGKGESARISLILSLKTAQQP